MIYDSTVDVGQTLVCNFVLERQYCLKAKRVMIACLKDKIEWGQLQLVDNHKYTWAIFGFDIEVIG